MIPLLSKACELCKGVLCSGDPLSARLLGVDVPNAFAVATGETRLGGVYETAPLLNDRGRLLATGVIGCISLNLKCRVCERLAGQHVF